MSAPYLEELAVAFHSGAKDLHQAAEMIGITFESACLSFNNGLLKGFWRIEVTPMVLPKQDDETEHNQWA